MATQLVKFERESIQPIAKRIFGSEAKRLKHIGTYNCRSMRQFKGVLSQHAFANALDVSGFVFKDGQSISVKRDWKVDGPKSQFLKELPRTKHLGYLFLLMGMQIIGTIFTGITGLTEL